MRRTLLISSKESPKPLEEEDEEAKGPNFDMTIDIHRERKQNVALQNGSLKEKHERFKNLEFSPAR